MIWVIVMMEYFGEGVRETGQLEALFVDFSSKQLEVHCHFEHVFVKVQDTKLPLPKMYPHFRF